MRIKFLGAVKGAGEVTGSRTLLTTPDGLKILIDFGMIQSNLGSIAETMQWNGRDFEFDVEGVNYLIVTHGHFDHTSAIPLLIKRGFKGKIIATAPTADFCKLSFPDNAKIMASDCEWANKRRPKNKLKPLYIKEEAENAVNYIQCYDYNTEIVLSDNVSVELLCAGHMLGACMPKITYKDEHREDIVVFTGDTSAKSGIYPFIRIADDIGNVDYIVTESTYGNKTHSKNNPKDILKRAVLETCIDNNKTCVIPVFSLQRSSEIIWLLREIYLEHNELYKIPIYLDSPMAVKAQGIIDRHREYWGCEWLLRDKELTNIFDWEVVEYIVDYKESQALNNPHPKIILSSSGMANGGRILNHLQSFLPVKGCKVLFCGYQAEGTLGRKLVEGNQKTVGINRKRITIRADVESFSMSSHADKNQLVEYLKTSSKNKLKKILINHGDEDAVKGLYEELTIHFKGVDVIIPEYNREIKL